MTQARDGDRSYRGTILLAVLGLSLLTTTRLIIRFSQRGESLPLLEAVLSGLATWTPWLVLAPLVFAAARRVPIEPPGLKHVVAIHGGFVIGIAILFGLARWGFSFIPWVDEKPLGLVDVTTAHFHLCVLSYALLAGSEQARRNWTRFQERNLRAALLETRLAQAQLASLQTQLHPHFLFNSLNAISALMHRDVDAAEELICLLSDLLRMNLKFIGQQAIPVSEELRALRLYTELQRCRFPTRLTYDVRAASDVLDQPVPTQVLQPIADSFIRQRIEVTSDPWHLHVAVAAADAPGADAIRYEVELRPARAAAATASRASDAPRRLDWNDDVVERTRVRLDALYGSKARADLEADDTGALRMRIEIPRAAPIAGASAGDPTPRLAASSPV